MFKKIVLITILNTVWLLPGCTPPCDHLYKQLYAEKNFTGRSLYDKNIGLCPVLLSDGVDKAVLSDKKLLETLKKTLPDLRVNRIEELEIAFKKNNKSELLANFYEKLYKSDMVFLQTSDSIWNLIQSDYLVVIRVKGGYSFKTFKSKILKRLDLETELWDCKNMEVVWRGCVESSCARNRPDRLLFSDAIKKALGQLPSPVPSYDDREW